MSGDVLKRNNVHVSGRGTQPMLFAHGFGCDQNMWRFVTPAFENDYRIVLFDYVGSGTLGHQAPMTRALRQPRRLRAGRPRHRPALDLRDVIFVGHSVSSMIGVLAAIREPDRFADLILIGPSPRYINDGEPYAGGFERADIDGLLEMMDKNFLGWANFLAPVIMKNPERPELAKSSTESFCSTDPLMARRFAEVTFLRQPRRPRGVGPLAHPAVLRRHDRPLDVGDVPQRAAAGKHAARHEGNGPLPAHEPSGRDDRADEELPCSQAAACREPMRCRGVILDDLLERRRAASCRSTTTARILLRQRDAFRDVSATCRGAGGPSHRDHPHRRGRDLLPHPFLSAREDAGHGRGDLSLLRTKSRRRPRSALQRDAPRARWRGPIDYVLMEVHERRKYEDALLLARRKMQRQGKPSRHRRSSSSCSTSSCRSRRLRWRCRPTRSKT